MKSEITLREGFETFNKKNVKYFSDRDTAEKAEEFFRRHDIAHVLFGCDTTIFGEGTVKIWTVFGTKLGFWKHIAGYSEAGAFALFRMYSLGHIAKNIFRLLVTIPNVIIKARRMSKPWDWSEGETYMDVPIDEIREEFGIEVIK